MPGFSPARAQEHLQLRLGWTSSRVEVLSGGLLNHVFRVHLDRGGSVIVKHAPPYVASRPELSLDPSRADFEARALAWVGQRADQRIGVPELLDAHENTLVMQDLGPCQDLGIVLGRGEGLDLLDTLGSWISRLHQDPGAPRVHNLPVQQTRFGLQYQGIAAILRAGGMANAEQAGARAEELGRRLLEPGTHFVMGDLWPASVLVDQRGRPWVIDWELSSLGLPAQDLGHLAAHLWMLSASGAVRPGLGARFLSRATEDRRLLDQERQDLLTHAACEVLMRAAGPFAGTGPLAEAEGEAGLSGKGLRWAAQVLAGWTPKAWGAALEPRTA